MSTITANDAERSRAALERQSNSYQTVIERTMMQRDTEKLNFDARQLSTWTPARGDGSPVSFTAQQKRQLRLLPKQGQSTLLLLNRNSCVVVALFVHPGNNIAYKYVTEPAFDEDEYGKPLTVSGVVDRMVRLIVANGVKPSSIVIESAWNGMDGAQCGMLHLVHRAARAFGDLLMVDVRGINLEEIDQMDRHLLSLVFLAKTESGAFESKAIRKAHDITTDYSAEILLQCYVFSDDPVAQAIHERRLSLRRTRES